MLNEPGAVAGVYVSLGTVKIPGTAVASRDWREPADGGESRYTRAMSNSFSVGDRVMRINDGCVGTVSHIGPGGDVGVRWEPSGIVQMVVPLLLKHI